MRPKREDMRTKWAPLITLGIVLLSISVVAPALAYGTYRVTLQVTDTSGASASASDEVTVATAVPPPGPPPALGVFPFGPFEPELADLGTRFSGGWMTVYRDDVVEELNAARAAGASFAINSVRSKKHYKNSDGTFNLDMWKGMVDVYADFDFAPWVEDGTIFVHYLIDEPKGRSNWGGEVIPNDVLDEWREISCHWKLREMPRLPQVRAQWRLGSFPGG